MFAGLIILLAWTAIASMTGYLALITMRESRVRRRLFGASVNESSAVVAEPEPNFLVRWLSLAGYRSPSSAPSFILTTLFLLCGSTLAAYVLNRSSILTRVMTTVVSAPGGVLDIFIPLIYAAPWLLVAVLTSLPWLIVRSARRHRVRDIERDLPLVLELLSTLAEAGLSFDAALDRVIVGQPPDRPLTRELRTFRAETLSGRPRVQSFRRLSRRIDISAFSSFISAIVQAEQIGSGVADVLRRQADDNRARRRERALEMAMALPVKRLVPLVVCFLPGILLWALGPSLFEFMQFVDAFSRNRGLR